MVKAGDQCIQSLGVDQSEFKSNQRGGKKEG